VLEKVKERTGKGFPNNGCLAHKAPLCLNLVHHEPARLVDEGGVQRRVLHKNEFHSRRVWWFESLYRPDRWVVTRKMLEQVNGWSRFCGDSEARGNLYLYQVTRLHLRSDC